MSRLRQVISDHNFSCLRKQTSKTPVGTVIPVEEPIPFLYGWAGPCKITNEHVNYALYFHLHMQEPIMMLQVNLYEFAFDQ